MRSVGFAPPPGAEARPLLMVLRLPACLLRLLLPPLRHPCLPACLAVFLLGAPADRLFGKGARFAQFGYPVAAPLPVVMDVCGSTLSSS